MLFAHMFMWGLGGFGYAQSIIGSSANQEDGLRFECGRQLVQISREHLPNGPLFFENGVMFSSVISNNGLPLLILQTRAGVYAVQLNAAAIKRVQIQLPLFSDSIKMTKIFVSYFHNTEIDRRYFEFSLDRPKPGRDPGDYRVARATLSPYLNPHLDHLLLEHIDTTATAVLDRRIKMKVQPTEIAACNQLAHINPTLARYSVRQLASIQRRGSDGVGARSPASFSP